jgi:hypothetical protein
MVMLAGCGDDSSPIDGGDVLIDRMETTCAETLSVDGWCVLDDSVEVRLTGIGGWSSCYEFRGVSVTTEGRVFTLLPKTRHLQFVGTGCLEMISLFDTTLVFQLPDTGEYWFKAPACEGDSLIASTRVTTADVFLASIDFVRVPGWCLMEDGIDVQLVGNAGAFEDFRVDHVEIEDSERSYTLRPFVRLLRSDGSKRRMDVAPFDTTVVLHPPEIGPWWITVEAANGTFVDSTKVK